MFGLGAKRNEPEFRTAVTGLLEELVRTLHEGLAENRKVTDQLRRDTANIINQRLESLSADLRDLRRALGDAHSDIAESRREVEALRLEVAATRREAAERGIAPTRRPSFERPLSGPGSVADGEANSATQAQAEDEFAHEQRLVRAAGVSAVDLVCHRDTWAFIVEQSARSEHFRVPGEVAADAAGQVRVTVSGRSLIAILTALYTARENERGRDSGNWALTWTFYQRIADAIDRVSPRHNNAPTGIDEEEPGITRRLVILIDDRPAQPDQGEEMIQPLADSG
ncbi:hypothetical protein [Streptomyces malaysiensis]|uniref:hypothetical protein n=1 Tax=Streptomyces malaysiensis TaxID=92644 RepID=UPI003220408D|nr:hypothetical protein [Streptomyces malaysiensis]